METETDRVSDDIKTCQDGKGGQKIETKRQRESLWPVLVLLVFEWFNGCRKTHTHTLDQTTHTPCILCCWEYCYYKSSGHKQSYLCFLSSLLRCEMTDFCLAVLQGETTQLCFKGTIFREGGLVVEEGRKFGMGERRA